MKNKKKLLIIIGFMLLIIIITTLIFIFYKNNDSNKKTNTAKERMYVVSKEDGWYYYFKTILIDNTTRNFFNGCNLKYETMEDYNILVYNEEKKIIGRISTYPTLGVSEKSKNGIMERDEVLKIDSYFDKKQFNKKITSEDLSDLELYNFSSEEIINLYNNTQDLEYLEELAKIKLDECTITSEKNTSDYTINIGILLNTDIFKGVWLDILYEDGAYLSDLVNSNKATTKQKELYSNFKEIEKYIIENNNIKDLQNIFKDYNTIEYQRLYTLANNILEENKD